MVDILDLDALLPEPTKIKLHGKLFDCLPLTIEQLIILAKLEENLKTIKKPEDIRPLIFNALKPIIPGLENLNFTINQLFEIAKFAQKASLPPENKTIKDFDVKKKINSVEESPISSDSTQPIPSIKS